MTEKERMSKQRSHETDGEFNDFACTRIQWRANQLRAFVCMCGCACVWARAKSMPKHSPELLGLYWVGLSRLSGSARRLVKVPAPPSPHPPPSPRSTHCPSRKHEHAHALNFLVHDAIKMHPVCMGGGVRQF